MWNFVSHSKDRPQIGFGNSVKRMFRLNKRGSNRQLVKVACEELYNFCCLPISFGSLMEEDKIGGTLDMRSER
jgi:hypothetical protein